MRTTFIKQQHGLAAACALALVKFSPRKWEVYEIIILAAFGLATISAIRMLAW